MNTPRPMFRHGSVRMATLLAATTLFVAACGGGGRSSAPAAPPAPPAAQAPSITGAGPIALDQDTTSAPLAIRLVDADTPVASLEFTATSSNPALLPNSGITIEGNGSDRTLRVTPSQEASGTATVTLTVRDPGGLTGSASVDVRVNAVLVSFRVLTQSAFSSAPDSGQAKVAGVTVQNDADDDPAAFDAFVQGGSQ
jgi:hypothetical protein